MASLTGAHDEQTDAVNVLGIPIPLPVAQFAIALVGDAAIRTLTPENIAYVQTAIFNMRTMAHDTWLKTYSSIARAPDAVQDTAYNIRMLTTAGLDAGFTPDEMQMLRKWSPPDSFTDTRLSTEAGRRSVYADYQDHVAVKLLRDIKETGGSAFEVGFRMYLNSVLNKCAGMDEMDTSYQTHYDLPYLYLNCNEEDQQFVRGLLQREIDPAAQTEVGRVLRAIHDANTDEDAIQWLADQYQPAEEFHDPDPNMMPPDTFDGTATNTTMHDQCPAPARIPPNATNTNTTKPDATASNGTNTTKPDATASNSTNTTGPNATASTSTAATDDWSASSIAGYTAAAGGAVYGALRAYRWSAGDSIQRPINYPAEVLHALSHRIGPFASDGRVVNTTDRELPNRLRRVQWAADALALRRDSVAAAACLTRWSAALKDTENTDWALALRMAFALCDDNRMVYPCHTKDPPNQPTLYEQHSLSFGLLARALCERFSLPNACMQKACTVIGPEKFVVKSYRSALPKTMNIERVFIDNNADESWYNLATQTSGQYTADAWNSHKANATPTFLCEHDIKIATPKTWLRVSVPAAASITPSRVIAVTDAHPRTSNTDIHVYALCGVVVDSTLKTREGISPKRTVYCVDQNNKWHNVYRYETTPDTSSKGFAELFGPTSGYKPRHMVFQLVETMRLNAVPSVSRQPHAHCRVFV
jgi:hypothetical protein